MPACVGRSRGRGNHRPRGPGLTCGRKHHLNMFLPHYNIRVIINELFTRAETCGFTAMSLSRQSMFVFSRPGKTCSSPIILLCSQAVT